MELRLRYNLQFFGDDKTEEPTSKKLDDARKKGQVGKSQELAHAIELIALFILLRATTSFLGQRFVNAFQWVYGTLIPEVVNSDRDALEVHTVFLILLQAFLQMGILLAPFFAVGFLVSLLANGLQFQFRVTTEPLKPKFSNFNPVNGVKRMFSMQSLINLGLAIVKIVLIFFVAYSVIQDHLNDLYVLYEIPLNAAIAHVGTIAIDIGLRISILLLVVGIVDLIYHKRKHKKDLKMTKQEVKDEWKNTEGDPQVKGKQKQRMREASQRRMMQSVPQADVVITNPTHVAVAIRYDRPTMDAPTVVAKGEEVNAQRIKDIAREHNVPIVENRPLARSLYETVEVGDPISPDVYQVVAEILVNVWQKQGKKLI